MLKFIKQLAGASVAPTIRIGGVALAREQEPLHVLFAGATGVGKSVGITEMLADIVGRGDRLIVADPNGYYASRFYRDGDIILNVFDRRTPGWSPAAEIRKPYDFDKLARSIVPDGHQADAAWHFYAQSLLAEAMRNLIARGDASTATLVHALTAWPAEELKQLVSGSAVAGLFDQEAGKALASTRFILSTYLKPYQYLKPGDFSLRTWLEAGQGSLFVTWREDMTAALAPLIACWLDVLCTASLSLPPDPQRRLWMVLDELASLGKISSLEAALTKGRKHGLCCVAGIQSTAQLDRVYGRETAVTLRSCFRNFVAFSLAKIDPDTSEVFSRALGEREVDRTVESESRGAQGSSKSVSVQRVRERLVLPNQLNELPDLTAYLARAGDSPAVLIQLRPRELPCLIEPIVED